MNTTPIQSEEHVVADQPMITTPPYIQEFVAEMNDNLVNFTEAMVNARNADLESPTISQIAKAVATAQANYEKLGKDRANDFFKAKYATLSSVYEAISDALSAVEVAVVGQTMVTGEGKMMLWTRLIHSSGEWLGSVYPIDPVKHDPQGQGSALTYARRYALMALVGIAPEDDDGNAAVASQRAERQGAAAQRQTEAAANVDPETGEIMKKIRAAGGTLGVAPARLRAKFATRYNMDIVSAPKEELEKFLIWLESSIASKGTEPAAETPPPATEADDLAAAEQLANEALGAEPVTEPTS